MPAAATDGGRLAADSSRVPVLNSEPLNCSVEERLVVGYQRGAKVESARGDQKVEIRFRDAAGPQLRLEAAEVRDGANVSGAISIDASSRRRGFD